MAEASSSAFKMKCPSCEAAITIRDPKLVGKKIDCQRCKFRFTVEMPAAAEEEVTKPVKKLTAEEVKKKQPTRREGPPNPRNKPLPKRDEDEDQPKKKPKKGSNLTLIIGGGLGLVTIGIIAAFLLGLFDSDSGTPAPKPNTDQVKNPNPGGEPKKIDPKIKVDPVVQEKEKEKPVGAVAADITNMLPEDSQWVLRLSGANSSTRPLAPCCWRNRAIPHALSKEAWALPATTLNGSLAAAPKAACSSASFGSSAM